MWRGVAVLVLAVGVGWRAAEIRRARVGRELLRRCVRRASSAAGGGVALRHARAASRLPGEPVAERPYDAEVAAAVGACLAAEPSCDTILNGPYDACWDRALAEVAPSSHLLGVLSGLRGVRVRVRLLVSRRGLSDRAELLDGTISWTAWRRARRKPRATRRNACLKDAVRKQLMTRSLARFLDTGGIARRQLRLRRRRGGGPAPGVTLHPVPGCESIDPAPCDVFDTTCQTRLLALAACMRGSAQGALPPISFMTEAEYAQYLTAQLAAEEPDPDLDHFRAGPRRCWGWSRRVPSRLRRWRRRRRQGVRGFYKPDTGDIVLIDHGTATATDDIQINGDHAARIRARVAGPRPGSARLVRYNAGTATTPALASRSIVEGEARFHQEHFSAGPGCGLDPAAIDWAAPRQQGLASQREWIVRPPSPSLATFFGVPLRVRRPAASSRDSPRAGPQSWRELFASPPANTRALMDYHDDAAGPAGPALSRARATGGMDARAETTLGAWLTYVFLALEGIAANRQLQALSWRANHLWVYGGTADRSATVAVWRIAFADAAVATTVAEGLALRFRFEMRQSGSELTVVATNAALPLDWAFAANATAAAAAAGDAPARADRRRWWPRGNRPMLPRWTRASRCSSAPTVAPPCRRWAACGRMGRRSPPSCTSGRPPPTRGAPRWWRAGSPASRNTSSKTS